VKTFLRTGAFPGRLMRSLRGLPAPSWVILPLGIALLLGGPPPELHAQEFRGVAVDLPHGIGVTLPIEMHRGYPAVAVSTLLPLGWELASAGVSANTPVRVLHRTGLELRFLPGSPYLSWEGDLRQLVHPPYWLGDAFYLPIQVVVDLLPTLLPNAYAYDPERRLLVVEGGSGAGAPGLAQGQGVAQGPGQGSAPLPPAPSTPPVATAQAASTPQPLPSPAASTATPSSAPPQPSGSPPTSGASRAPRIVIIDPGHGGIDPGAVGPSGAREKDIALAVGQALARELSGDPQIEVRMTRDRDVEVEIWSRGEWATEWKGDRPGVFISIHANALPDRPGVRGFETYFLSDARDEHERRVAALENSPMRSPEATSAISSDPLLDVILRDLRTFDHQHWSALLAEQVQRELSTFHPGTDRGVKQGPFAVITNSIMPSVLVEVGFITNPEEERLMLRPEFHRDSAQALARAIRSFFDRYPPGGGAP